jgi:hypothetical protein
MATLEMASPETDRRSLAGRRACQRRHQGAKARTAKPGWLSRAFAQVLR